MRIRNATDLGLDLDAIACRRAPREWVYEEGGEAWQWSAFAHVAAGLESVPHLTWPHPPIPCPVCAGAALKTPARYCLACDRAGLDRKFGPPGAPSGYPGLAVDAVRNEAFIKAYGLRDRVRKYRAGRLKGGVG